MVDLAALGRREARPWMSMKRRRMVCLFIAKEETEYVFAVIGCCYFVLCCFLRFFFGRPWKSLGVCTVNSRNSGRIVD